MLFELRIFKLDAQHQRHSPTEQQTSSAGRPDRHSIMTLRERHEKLKGALRTSLSPPVWKDQLKQRCMQRLRQDRHLLLAKLRSPDATRTIADEMKRLVYHVEQREATSTDAKDVLEKQQQQWRPRPSGARHPVFDLQREEEDDDAMMSCDFNGVCDSAEETPETGDASVYASIEELVTAGKLSEDDYLEIVHALEDELLIEMYDGRDDEEQLVEQMVEFEEASLEAMLAGMDLDDPAIFCDDEFDNFESMIGNSGVHVLCPICKVGSLKETSTGSFPVISCACGFHFQTQQEPLYGVLEDFQETIAAAFMAHRECCYADPSFEKAHDFETSCDAIRIVCRTCNTSRILP